MTNLDSILKSRDNILLTKVCLVNAMVFPPVMYWCESWTIKTVEHRRIDAFKLCCWRRFLTVPWTAKRSNHSILKGINPEYSLDWCWSWSSNTVATWLIQRVDPLEKTLMLGKIEGKRRRGQQRMRWLDGITDSMDMNLSKLGEIVKDRGAWRATVHRVETSWTRLSNWTTCPQDQQRSHFITWCIKDHLILHGLISQLQSLHFSAHLQSKCRLLQSPPWITSTEARGGN